MTEAQTSWMAFVSFATMPLAEISQKVAEIVALGWEDAGRGDPWLVSFRKTFVGKVDAEAELRDLMGDYWLTADDIHKLRSK